MEATLPPLNVIPREFQLVQELVTHHHHQRGISAPSRQSVQVLRVKNEI